VVSLLPFNACAAARPAAIVPEAAAVDWRDLAVRHCDLSTFARGRGHEIRLATAPLVVRRVEGRIHSETGTWPRSDAFLLLFELRALQGGPITAVETDHEGKFKLPELVSGRYCFSASAVGWDPIMGILIVTPKAPRAARIELTLPISN
jgi:hypothetical protein